MTVLDLAGYLDQFEPGPRPEVYDANGLLQRADVCRAVTCLRLGAGTEDREQLAGSDEVFRLLMAVGPWPVFTVELARGGALHVLWRNLEGDAGVELLLRTSDGQVHRVGEVGSDLGPGLSWDEWVRVSTASTVPGPSETLLLLFPFAGGLPRASTAQVLRAAIRRLGAEAGPRLLDRLAETADTRHQQARPDTDWAELDGVTTFVGAGSARGPATAPAFRHLVAHALR